MPRNAKHNKKLNHTGTHAQSAAADRALIALVRLLARQAAEQDYKAFQLAQEAANDNEK